MEFRIGLVLSRTWDLFQRRALTFLTLTGGFGLLIVVSGMLFHAGGHTRVMFWVDSLCTVAVFGISQAVVILATLQEMRGDVVPPTAAVSSALRSIFPLFLVSGIYIGSILGGLVLCVVPGLFFIGSMSVSIAACVVEHLSLINSLLRSIRLSKGRGLQIAGLFGAWWAIAIAAWLITGRAIPGEDHVLLNQLVTWLWRTPLSTYLAVMTAVLYHDLRSEKEGIGIKEIAAVFD